MIDRPTFFFAAMSPYSWFAAERIDNLIPKADWRPISAGGLFKLRGRLPWSLDERRPAGMIECAARAETYGLGPITWPESWPTRDLEAGRAMLVAREAGELRSFALAAMRLAFREGRDLSEIATLEQAAAQAGLDPEALTRAIQTSEVKAALREQTESAAAAGVIGVPTVRVGQHLYWGDDRLEEAANACAAAAIAGDA